MMIEAAVGIVITGGKVYVPTLAKTSIGFFEIEPVITANANVTDLAQTITQARNQGNPVLSDEQLEKQRKQKLTILKATKQSSQKKLAKHGASYTIIWTDKHISLSMSKLDNKGRWVSDEKKQRKLPLDTSIEEIANLIMQDAKSRSEVW